MTTRPGPGPGSRPGPGFRPGPGSRPGAGSRPGSGYRRPGRPRYYARRKVCAFCVDHVKYIDYKQVERFHRFLSNRFKIEARRKTGVCSKHQRGLRTAIKRARHLALLPFSPGHQTGGAGWS